MKTFDDIIEGLGFARGTRKFSGVLDFRKEQIGTLSTDFDWPSEIQFETLWLDYQNQITHLPENISVEDNLDLRGCESLTHLPENLSMGGNLDLYGCTSVTHLPENISVGGYLNLRGCTSLTHLPENLSMGGYLDLRGCKIITHLPENISVKYDIHFDNNVSVPGKAFKNGLTYAEGKFKVVNPNYPILRKIFLITSNAEHRRELINILGPEHTAKMLDAVEFKTGKVGKENVRILRTRKRDRMINSHHYWVEVRCPSTDRMYMLPIPPSRTKSCVDAVAYTFGLTGKEYAPLIET